MNNIYFNNVIQIGKLYLEHIFYKFESEPILFSCTDQGKNIYLCLCSDIRYEQKWVVTKCNIDILESLVEQKIDIASVFLIFPYIITITMDLEGNECSCIIEHDQIDRLDLPEEGVYLRCDKEQAESYLQNKKSEVPDKYLKLTDTIPTADEKIKAYKSIIYEKRLCSDLIGGVFTRQFVKSTEPRVQLSGITSEYCTHSKEKYRKIIRNIDVANTKSDYLQAV